MLALELRAADDHGDGASLVGQEHCRLAGRVAAADHHHRVAGALAGFQFGGGVVDAGRLELGQPVDLEAPVAGAAGGDDRSTGHRGPVGQLDDEVTGLLTASKPRRTGR